MGTIGRLLIFLFFCGFLGNLSAEKFLLSDVKVFGNSNFDAEMIVANSGLQIGFETSTDELKEVVRRLDSLDLFEDIEIVREGTTLLIYIKENKLIDKIVFKGNLKIDSKTIKAEVGTLPSYAKHKVSQMVEKINYLYQKKGYLSVGIRHEVVQSDLNPQKVNLIFRIHEGKKAVIRQISMRGNEAFGARKLKKIIRSREFMFYNLLSDAVIFNDDLLMLDQELLRMHYMNHGYYNFQVKNVYVESNDDKSKFFVTYDLEEGHRYRIGQVNFDEQLWAVEGLQSQCAVLSNMIFNQNFIDNNVLHMIDFLNDHGFALADIKVNYDVDEENRIVNVNFSFVENAQLNIRNINISGNSSTQDHVIRRRLEIEEGQQYSKKKIVRSKNTLNSLGIFKDVNLYNHYDGKNLDLQIDVIEGNTTSVNIGGGYDTSRGLIGNFNINEKNFRGLGQSLSLDINKNISDLDVMCDFFEPYISAKWSGGLGLFAYLRDRDNRYHKNLFTKKTKGYYGSVGYQISNHWLLSLNHSFKINEISDVSKNSSTFIKQQQGKYSVNTVGHKIRFSNTDNSYYPTRGFDLSFGQNLAIPWGEARFLKNDFSGYFYKTLKKGIIWQTVFKAGYIRGYSKKKVRIEDRYFLGSDEIRGFDFQGIGPRDAASKDALGGQQYVLLKLQLERNLPFLREIDLKASVFVDNAILHKLENLTSAPGLNIVANDSSIRCSVGAGLSWMTPFGSMRVDYGIPVHYDKNDRVKRFRFIVGGEF